MHYRRVTNEQRRMIEYCLSLEMSQIAIAQHLKLHKSTICRELKRNRVGRKYIPEKAGQLAKRRFKACRRPRLIQGELEIAVMNKLRDKWSPEQITGRFRLEGTPSVSHQTIYRFVRRRGKRERRINLRRFNKRGAGRHRMRKRKKRLAGLSIMNRPDIANRRGRFGDWERDCMYGANRKVLLVCTERKSKYTKLAKIPKLTANDVGILTQSLLDSTGRKVFSVTNDNGSEFADPCLVKARVFYCQPYKPQQRGTVENTIGLIRQYISRKTDLDALTDKDITDLEKSLNLRPRKCLGYRTPYEVFHKTRVALAN